MSRLVLDAGAFIALDRNDRAMWGRLARAERQGRRMVTHAGIVGQVWRRPDRQARLARALQSVEVLPLDDALARQAGRLLAATGTDDVHDGALALLCQAGDVVCTGDVEDLGDLLAERGLRRVGLLRV